MNQAVHLASWACRKAKGRLRNEDRCQHSELSWLGVSSLASLTSWSTPSKMRGLFGPAGTRRETCEMSIVASKASLAHAARCSRVSCQKKWWCGVYWERRSDLDHRVHSLSKSSLDGTFFFFGFLKPQVPRVSEVAATPSTAGTAYSPPTWVQTVEPDGDGSDAIYLAQA